MTVGFCHMCGTRHHVKMPCPRRGTETVAVHVRDGYDLRIDRSRAWGNPFRIGEHGTREEVIAKFESMWRERIRRDGGGVCWDTLKELRGMRLGCFCKPLPCHGDVYVKLIGELELIYD